ncbi:hypothetical protein [Nocardia puris]|uniref:Uncharacterized protein n=1 Tax=Nocardia puris TaxID=208602 RepID=A0A366DW02_9NOCA|nr:hypothetical protein [Nocardia puris]RBO93709.1 hypothetical protein DFR74_102126 [Nocardia puris]
MVDDVEKRWSEPGTFRRAVRYDLGVIAVAALVAAVTMVWAARRDVCLDGPILCDTPARLAVVLGPGLVLLAGGIGAFVLTVRTLRRGGAWPIWQGAGWFLLVLMVFYLAIGGGTAGS